MNLKLVLPMLFAVISTCALADGLLMSHILRSGIYTNGIYANGIDTDKFIVQHIHMKKIKKALTKYS